MTGKVFICWSGDRSHAIAEAVQKLLEANSVTAFLSNDIEKGTFWFDSILVQLQQATAGIVCLTRENLQSPWMHFEAGALAGALAIPADTPGKGDSSRRSGTVEAVTSPPSPEPARPARALFTILHGVKAAEISGPLSAYQATSTTTEEMGCLVRSIQRIVGQKGQDNKSILNLDDFTGTLERITVRLSEIIRDLEQLFHRKTFNEPLYHCTDKDWRARYDGARVTRQKLNDRLDEVTAACSTHERQLFEMLLAELDGYAMATHSLLFKPRDFDLGNSGELEVDESIRNSCEDRRLAVKSIVARLLRSSDDPLTGDAVRFMAAETNEERKMIVHRLEERTRQGWEEANEDVSKGKARQGAMETALTELAHRMLAQQVGHGPTASNGKPIRLMQFRASSWDLDRIYYYLLVHYFTSDALRWESPAPADTSTPYPAGDHDLVCAARDVELELERYRAKSKGGSLMPLSYGLDAFVTLWSRKETPTEQEVSAKRSALTLVETELEGELQTEAGRAIGRLMANIRQEST